MANLDFIRKTVLIIASLLGTSAPIYSKEAGGKANAKTLLSAENELRINVDLPTCDIACVTLNNRYPAQGIIGGSKGGTDNEDGSAYAALVSPLGVVQEIDLNIPQGFILSSAINDSNQGIIGGGISGNFYGYGPAYVARISPKGVAHPFDLQISNGYIQSVAISNAGQAIFGGHIVSGQYVAGPAYAAITTAQEQDVVQPINLSILSGGITSVAINNSNLGIIGGYNSISNSNGNEEQFPYAALISPSGTMDLIDFNSSQGAIKSVAMNNSDQGMIGGNLFDPNAGIAIPYVATISPSKKVNQIPLSNSRGTILSVALNDFNQGLIGGYAFVENPNIEDFRIAYAAMISAEGIATPIELTQLQNNYLNYISVAVNNYNQGLISGNYITFPDPDSAPVAIPFAALISPQGIATPIFIDPAVQSASGASNNSNLGIIGGTERIFLFSLIPISTIPAISLKNNNVIYANYINQSAPQHVYDFIPAIYASSLSKALESASPVRNGITTYTASNNLFYATSSLSTHLHKSAQGVSSKEPFSTIWFEAVGVRATQKAQNQTGAFSPTVDGGILAIEKKMGSDACFGLGASYLHTHVYEKEKAGHIGIHQEDLILYTSVKKGAFYFDGTVLGGLYQAHQVRHIILPTFGMTKASSSPKGWQIMPHGELGMTFAGGKNPQKIALTLNPFISVDWANSWQKRVQDTGNSSFNFCQKAHYSSLLRTEASVRLCQTISFNRCRLTLQEKGGYVNKRSFGAGKVEGFLVGSPSSFTLETMSSAQNLGVAGAAMTFESAKSFLPKATFSYQGEFSRQLQSHQLGLEMAWSF